MIAQIKAVASITPFPLLCSSNSFWYNLEASEAMEVSENVSKLPILESSTKTGLVVDKYSTN